MNASLNPRLDDVEQQGQVPRTFQHEMYIRLKFYPTKSLASIKNALACCPLSAVHR